MHPTNTERPAVSEEDWKATAPWPGSPQALATDDGPQLAGNGKPQRVGRLSRDATNQFVQTASALPGSGSVASLGGSYDPWARRTLPVRGKGEAHLQSVLGMLWSVLLSGL